MVTMLKRYNPWVYKVLVRPLALVERIQSAKCGLMPKLPTGNPMFSNDHKTRVREQQQQDISKLDSFLSNLGIKFTRDNVAKLWRMSGKSMSEITTAVEYLLHAHSTQKTPIRNPHGFLVASLKYGWHHGFNLQYQTKLPMFENVRDIFVYVKAALTNQVTQVEQPI
jgi:hypothetical protein